MRDHPGKLWHLERSRDRCLTGWRQESCGQSFGSPDRGGTRRPPGTMDVSLATLRARDGQHVEVEEYWCELAPGSAVPRLYPDDLGVWPEACAIRCVSRFHSFGDLLPTLRWANSVVEGNLDMHSSFSDSERLSTCALLDEFFGNERSDVGALSVLPAMGLEIIGRLLLPLATKSTHPYQRRGVWRPLGLEGQ